MSPSRKSFKNKRLLPRLPLARLPSLAPHAASWQDSLTALPASGMVAPSGQRRHVRLFANQPAQRQQPIPTASSMNNAAGILSYCAKQKLASVTSADNVKNQVLDKLGLSTPEKQKTGHQLSGWPAGLLNSKNGQQLDLNTLGNSSLAKQVKNQSPRSSGLKTGC